MLVVFLPQLLLYPNPSNPLNGETVALLMHDHAAYEQKLKGDFINLTHIYSHFLSIGLSLGSFQTSIKREFISFIDMVALHPDLSS